MVQFTELAGRSEAGHNQPHRRSAESTTVSSARSTRMWITPLVVFAMLATLLWFNRGDNRDGSQSHQVQLSQTRTSLAPRLRNTLKSAPVAGPGATSAPLNDHANQNKNSPSVKAVVTFASMDTSGAWARTVPLLREVACMLKAHHPGGVTTAVRFQVPSDDQGKAETARWFNSTANRCGALGARGLDSLRFVDDSAAALAARARAGSRNRDKAARIRQIRDSFRAELSIDHPMGLVLFDGDMKKLPLPAEIARSVGLVLNGTWDLLCSNGQMGHAHTASYYDTFATVLKDGSYPFKQLYMDVSTNGRNPKREAALKHKLFADLDIGFKTQQIIPAQSCFGGLAVYGPRYFDQRCNYSYRDVPVDYVPAAYHGTLKSPCEHVALHLCLRHITGDKFAGGIVSSMKSWWSGS